eukprot:gb/GECG01011077.1/.p1 GENE.gb/GECG01011077.1/~~gb/GECG01011077.1/.p1  ORF type:complete len:390 (+),score=28.29 gb/GECG01011077.1/:1-1170(+)
MVVLNPLELDPFKERQAAPLDPTTDIEPFRRWWAPTELWDRVRHLGYPIGAYDPSQRPLTEIVDIPEFYKMYTDVPQFLYAVALAAVAWGLFDQLLKRVILPLLFGSVYTNLNRSDKVKWDNYCFSTIHAAAVSTIGLYLSIPIFPWHIFNARLMFHSTYELGLLNIFSGGFFVFDFFRHIMDWSIKGSPGMLAHHVISIGTIFGCTCSTPSTGVMIVSTFYVFEITTPFLHVRWFLWKLGRSTTKLYVLNGLLLIAMFFVFRVLLATVLITSVVRDYVGYVGTLSVPQYQLWTYYALIVMALMLCLMQYYWFALLVGKAIEIARNLGKKKEEQSEPRDKQQKGEVNKASHTTENLRLRKSKQGDLKNGDLGENTPKSAAVDDLSRRVL